MSFFIFHPSAFILSREPAVGVEPTHSALRERRSANRAAPAFFQHPRQESNLHDLRLRRAACIHHTPGTSSQYPSQESNLDLRLRRAP
jgi:hypothetical protein